jgi:hypothetical protein
MMAFSHGKNTVFKLDDSGATLRDISAYLTSVSFPRSQELAETTTFGATAKTFLAGFGDATISIEGNWDPTVDGYLAGILGQAATVSFEYGPEGGTTGDIKFSGEAILTSYETSSGINDVTTFSAELQVSAGVTRGTFA